MIRGTMILLTTVSPSFTPQDDPYESQPSTSTHPYHTPYEDDQQGPFTPQYSPYESYSPTPHSSHQLSTSTKGKGKGKSKGNRKKDLCNRYNDKTFELNNAMDDCKLDEDTLEFILQKRDEMDDQYNYCIDTHNSNLYGSVETGVDNQGYCTYGNNNFNVPSTSDIKKDIKHDMNYPYIERDLFDTPVNEPQHLNPNLHVIEEDEILTVDQIKDEIKALEEMKNNIVIIKIHKRHYDDRTITGIKHKLYIHEIVESCCAYALDEGNLFRENVSEFRMTVQEFTCFDSTDEILKLGNFTSWAEIVEKHNKTSDLRECCNSLSEHSQEILDIINKYVKNLEHTYLNLNVRPTSYLYSNQHNDIKQKIIDEIDNYNCFANDIRLKIELIKIVRKYTQTKQLSDRYKSYGIRFGKKVINFTNLMFNKLRDINHRNVDITTIVDKIKSRLSDEARVYYDEYCKYQE